MSDIRKTGDVEIEVLPSRGAEKFQGRIGNRHYYVMPNPEYKCPTCRDTGLIAFGYVLKRGYFTGQTRESSLPCGACGVGREIAARMSNCEKCHAPLNPDTAECTDPRCKMRYPQRRRMAATFHEVFDTEEKRRRALSLIGKRWETVGEQNPPDDGTEPFEE